jgi:hypothetical protein
VVVHTNYPEILALVEVDVRGGEAGASGESGIAGQGGASGTSVHYALPVTIVAYLRLYEIM